MQVRKMRLLRKKYGITRPELGRACALSTLRIDEIEQNAAKLTPETEEKLQRGFDLVVQGRENALHSLRGDLARYGASLFEIVEETDYEL